MSIRLCTLGVPLFRAGGLDLNQRWLALPTLSEKQRTALRDYHGRFIQVHPADIEKLGEFGLAFQNGGSPLVDAPKKSKTNNTKTDAPKGDADGKADAKKER